METARAESDIAEPAIHEEKIKRERFAPFFARSIAVAFLVFI
jgi:hypothetical protein